MRRGMYTATVPGTKTVNKMFFKDKSLEKEAALQKIEAALGSVDVVKQFVSYIRSSEKGVYR